MRLVRGILYTIYATLLWACAHNPHQQLMQQAKQYRLLSLQIPSEPYILEAFHSHQIYTAKDLHIYLEGDGIPWINGQTIAQDPTPQKPLALKLMAADSHPSLYLSRPCYSLPGMPAHCKQHLWTSARYSQEVVDAMSHALSWLKREYEIKHFTLIGYSGGGSLAVLIASQRDDVRAVLTVAANLDHKSWTQRNHYEALSHSLNPIDTFPLDKGIRRWHLVAGKDRTIDSDILTVAATKDKGSQIVHYDDFNHHCCWEKAWPQIIDRFLKD